MIVLEAQINGVRVFLGEYPDGSFADVAISEYDFPELLRERVIAALDLAAAQGRPGELRLIVNGVPRYEYPYRQPAEASASWLLGQENSKARRRVARGLRLPPQQDLEENGRRTFDHELAARLHAEGLDYAAVARALRVSPEAVRQAVKRNVERLDRTPHG